MVESVFRFGWMSLIEQCPSLRLVSSMRLFRLFIYPCNLVLPYLVCKDYNDENYHNTQNGINYRLH